MDGPSYLYRAYHAIGHLSTSRGLPTNATLGMTMMLWKLLREDRPSYMGIAWDAPGPTFRHQQFEAYKLQRPGMPKDLVEQIPWVRRSLEALGLPVARGARVRGRRHPGDRGPPAPRHRDRAGAGDGRQGRAPARRTRASRCSRSLGRTGERVVYDAAKVEEKWGVPPVRIPDILALMGDSIDNIPGVPGVGEVTAQKLLREFGSLEALYANLAVVTGPKLREALARHRDQAFLSRQLAVLEGALPIEFDLEQLPGPGARVGAAARALDRARVHGAAAPGPGARRGPARRDRAGGRRGGVARVPRPRRRAPRRRARPGGERAGLHPPRRGGVRAGGRRGLSRGLGRSSPPTWRSSGTTRRRFVAWARGAGVALGAGSVDDTAVAAYLLNSGAERLSARPADAPRRASPGCPGALETLLAGTPVGDADPAQVAAWTGARAEGVWRLAEAQAAAARRARARVASTRRSRCRWSPSSPTWSGSGSGSTRSASGRLAKELDTQLDTLLREIHQLAGEPVNPNSPKQLAVVLFEKLKLPPLKRTKTGYSTDVDVLEELALGHALPGKILEYRQLSKLKGTYADALPDAHPSADGAHPHLVQPAGRGDGAARRRPIPNLQNIPIRTELGRRIRQAFIPEDGLALRGRRLLADRAADPRALLGGAGAGRGVPAQGRTSTRARPRRSWAAAAEAVTSEMRRLAKVVNFGILYGLSGFGLSQAVSIGRAEAQRFIDDYFATHPRVRAYIDRVVAEGRAQGYVTTLLGRRRYLPELGARNPVARNAAERMAANAPIQGTASDIIKLAMVRLGAGARRAGTPEPRCCSRSTTSSSSRCRRPRRAAVRALLPEVMEAVVTLAVPLRVDVKEGRDWAEV